MWSSFTDFAKAAQELQEQAAAAVAISSGLTVRSTKIQVYLYNIDASYK
jgi:hypothetical protein